jgi:hypothetical protein
MNRKKQKPYLEFGGNAFYIELNSILETIKIDSPIELDEPKIDVEPKVEVKSTKKVKSKKLVEPEPEPFSDEEILVSISEMSGAVQIDISKWEILKLMLEVIMSSQNEVDDKLGMTGLNNGTSIPFKLAFNTLLRYDILKEEE